jgi:hypothetical protein
MRVYINIIDFNIIDLKKISFWGPSPFRQQLAILTAVTQKAHIV